MELSLYLATELYGCQAACSFIDTHNMLRAAETVADHTLSGILRPQCVPEPSEDTSLPLGLLGWVLKAHSWLGGWRQGLL